MADPILYKRPYFDSAVFIGWIKNERILQKGPDGKALIGVDGKEIYEERGKIGQHLLRLAAERVFPVVISALTLAEVHKDKGKEKLNQEQDETILAFFESDFISVVPVTREIGEEANKLCRKHIDKKLSPNDAIHLACAKQVKCDVLLSWDGPLNSIHDPDIRIEKPILWMPEKKPEPMKQINLLEAKPQIEEKVIVDTEIKDEKGIEKTEGGEGPPKVAEEKG